MHRFRIHESVFGFFLASAIWALGFVFLSSQPPQPPSQNQSASHTPNEAPKGENEKSIWKPSDPVSLYTLVLAFFSCALVIISAIQIRFLILADRTARISAIAARRAANAARNQVNIAKKALIAAERAWISIDVLINGNLSFDAQGNATVYLLYIVKNVGRSPATNVRVNGYVVIHSPKRPDVIKEYRDFCSVIRMSPSPVEHLSYTLFPEEIKRIPLSQMISSDQITEATASWKEQTGQDWTYIAVHIMGCVSYRIPLDDNQHQTGFLTELRRKMPGDAGMLNLEETTVLQNDLVLIHSPWGSPSID